RLVSDWSSDVCSSDLRNHCAASQRISGTTPQPGRFDMKGKRFLLCMWEGGGTVPPELGLARKLIARGHAVDVLGDPTIEAEAKQIGRASCRERVWRWR